MVALLIDKILRLLILAPGILDRYLRAVLVDDIAQLHRAGGFEDRLREGEAYGLGAVVDFKLRVKKKLQFLEKLRDRPMRQGAGVLRRVPCRRERVAYKEVAVFLRPLPLREVA